MERLSAQDPDAIELIDKIKAMAMRRKDTALKGYAYYRYAYYYYFTVQDLQQFRKNVQIAVHFLSRCGDREYLASAYNLIAYDALDLGCYDVAYAYYMMAVRESEQEEGIALPGLVEASAGRLLIELGEYKKGRKQQLRAVRRMRAFPKMHTFHYNMILTYADIALASFLLGDLKEVERCRARSEEHYRTADQKEKKLSRSYFHLVLVYKALLDQSDDLLEENLHALLRLWESLSWGNLYGLIFEIESLCGYMLSHDYINQVEQILAATTVMSRDENPTIALRYHTLQVLYYEKVHDLQKLKECLRAQHALQQRREIDVSKTVRYAMEFSDMIDRIATDLQDVEQENLVLQRKANTDVLTGLPNRKAMGQVLQQKLDEAEESHTRFGIGIVDIDRFKQYNDTFGHRAGDECLKKIGKVLRSFNEDPRMFCTRYGGDEFVIGYFDMSTREIHKIDQEMQAQVTALRMDTGETIRISQGICNAIPNGNKKLWDYLRDADKKLYKIKKELNT